MARRRSKKRRRRKEPPKRVGARSIGRKSQAAASDKADKFPGELEPISRLTESIKQHLVIPGATGPQRKNVFEGTGVGEIKDTLHKIHSCFSPAPPDFNVEEGSPIQCRRPVKIKDVFCSLGPRSLQH
jgi:hypothetical protein